MYVQDIMTTNVVTIPSSTSITEAKRMMEVHRFRRLPVVDKGKLVGIVTERRLESVSPTKATSLTYWELSYLLLKTSVKEIMERNVVIVSPDTTVEEAVALAQSNKVGSLVVMDDGRVAGMVTTNDFFYKIVNPLLGLGEPGSRIEITGGGGGKALEDIISTVNKLGFEIIGLHIEKLPEVPEWDLCVHVSSEEVSQLLTELEGKGYKASLKKR